jgi:hypothetical protein
VINEKFRPASGQIFIEHDRATNGVHTDVLHMMSFEQSAAVFFSHVHKFPSLLTNGQTKYFFVFGTLGTLYDLHV